MITALDKNFDSMAEVAVELTTAGQAAEAEKIYQRLLVLDPPSPAALRAYTVFLISHGRLLEAFVRLARPWS